MPRLSLAALGLIAGTALNAAAPASVETQLSTSETRYFERETLAIIDLLQGYHYSDRRFVELDAKELLEQFASSLDPWRMTFTAPDLDYVRRRFERNLKTVYLFKGDLHPAFEIYDLFAKRAAARNDWIDSRLSQPLDLAGPGTFPLSRTEQAWPADAAAADVLWEQRIKAEIISARLRGLDEPEAVAEVRRAYSEYRKRIAALDALIVRERFVDTMLRLFDPHSGYFRPEAATEFGKELSTVADGTGLGIKTWHDRVFVRSIDPSSPADRDGTIAVGDEILSIAAPATAPVPVKGLKDRQVLALLSGASDSVVILSISHRGQPTPVAVSLRRSEFAATDYRARAALLHVPGAAGDIPVGLVIVPAFYGRKASAEDDGKASVSRDVSDLIEKLSAHGAKGIVLDLRDNGGGLLDEAVKLTGLFIRKGPVISVRGLDSKVVVSADEDPRVAYTGPLVVLTSPGSASASEAFAGALQAYHRALIVGGPATFGKGTAQGVIDLRRLQPKTGPAPAEWGLLRLTQEYFYLPSGKSTQRTGVASDIVLPDGRDWSEYCESAMPHALQAHSIEAQVADPAAATRGTSVLDAAMIARLKNATAERMRTMPEFELERATAELQAKQAARKEVALNLESRRTERAANEADTGALNRERRRLRAAVSFPMSLVDTDEVIEAGNSHQETLRRRLKAGGEDRTWTCDGSTILEEVKPGLILEVAADQIDYTSHLADSSELADAWSTATGTLISSEQMCALLRSLERYRENGTPEDDVRDVFRRHAIPGTDEPGLANGMEAVFKAMVALDPPGICGTPRFDVARREGLRLIADWVQWAPQSTPETSLTGSAAH